VSRCRLPQSSKWNWYLNTASPCCTPHRVKTETIKRTKSDAELLDQATGQLLRAIEDKAVKQQGRLDTDKLRKDGYSERFIAKVEAA
jgi:hypothetical protein